MVVFSISVLCFGCLFFTVISKHPGYVCFIFQTLYFSFYVMSLLGLLVFIFMYIMVDL